MGERKSLKRGISGLLAATALATAFTIYINATNANSPTLAFEGAELVAMGDGSVQMKFTIYVEHLANSSGAAFYLDYNQTYLTLSNQTTNEAIVHNGLTGEDGFFSPDPDLYKPGENPFQEYPFSFSGKSYYSQCDIQAGYIAMELKTIQNIEGGKLKKVAVGVNEDASVFDSSAEKVALGTISFRVQSEYLPKVVELFHGMTEAVDPTKAGDFLIKPRVTSETQVEPWQISGYKKDPNQDLYQVVNYTATNPAGNPGRAVFSFHFPETVISVEAAERAVVVDAYQAYHDGTKEDLSNLLRKYSPMVTATYADGARVNYVMPWGLKDDPATNREYGYMPYIYDENTPGHVGAQMAAYDPAGNAAAGEMPDYIVQQYFYYESGADEGGNPVYKRHPVPITATVAITPITLTGISCEGQEQSYVLNNALLSQITTISDLKLPNRARLTTDITPDGSALTIDIPGWKSVNADTTWPTGTLDTLIADECTDKSIHWPTAADSGQLASLKEKRLGSYSFVMSETMGGSTEYQFSAGDIKQAYPWLTVPNSWGGGFRAVRRLQEETVYTDAAQYFIQHLSTTTDAINQQPVLTLQAAKGNGIPEHDLSGSTEFRLRLPDGTDIEEAWFAPATGGTFYANSGWTSSSAPGLGAIENLNGINVQLRPGDLDALDAYAEQRELLRRYINLGGWFYVSLREDIDHEWSDYIPVYVPPRENLYAESVEYNFIGDNRGLHDYPGLLGTTVILPRGEYVPLNDDGTYRYKDADGKPVYITADGDETVAPETNGVKNRLKTDRYGVSTTYDGTTGRSGGRLYTFGVDAWTETHGETATIHGASYSDITRYGPNPLRSQAIYAAYGMVGQNGGSHNATMRFQPDGTPAQTGEQIALTGAGTGLSTDIDNNVTLVTYDTQKEGYTARQEVTLTITNTGAVPLYGLDIDTVTDAGASDLGQDSGNHFRLLKPPASFLAPGQSTTFTLTYQFALKNKKTEQVLDYIDTLFITSSSHPDVADPLMKFDVKFRVSDTDVHRVTVKYTPVAGEMGTAGTIIGEIKYSNPAPNTPVHVMDFAPGSYTFTQGETVYISAHPEDEYTIKSITYTYPGMSGSKPPTPDPYLSGDGTVSAEIPEPYKVYSFEMPADDVVVEVVYEESIYSKLRLSNMVDYSADGDGKLKPNTASPAAEHTFQVYQKAFTEQEQKGAEQFVLDSKDPDGNTRRTEAEYFMQVGRATVGAFDPSNDQYLVVIPPDATRSQVEVTLRQVNTAIAGNAAITPDVSMEILPTDPKDTSSDALTVTPNHGDTNGPTTHVSAVFASPEQGKSRYVRVTTSYKPPDATETVYRYYYLEIHRRTEKIEATLKYGNSPYGMILNATNIPGLDTATNVNKKEDAKKAFVANGYSFANLDAANVPKVVQEIPAMAGIHYWSEAWVAQDSRYEPDSQTAMEDYDEKNNLDLSPVSLFVLSTEGFTEPGIMEIKDNSGRVVDPANVARYVDVVVLDDAKTPQAGRFGEPAAGEDDRVGYRIPLGLANDPDVTAGWVKALVRATDPVTGDYIKDENGDYTYIQKVDSDTGDPLVDANGSPVYETEPIKVRPGVYHMVYSFLDYDSATTVSSVTRPLVILPPVGDVNADGKINSADMQAVKNRVTDPLGYTAEGYGSGGVFRYRSCDTNNDRNINNIDANVIRGYTAGDILRFYLPTGYVG